MSIHAEFQEREFETLFNQELTKLGCFTWSPGQTDEFLLGFDGATWIDPLKLMRFGFRTPNDIPAWYRFRPMWEPEFWYGRELSPSLIQDWFVYAEEMFPPIALNFFVQHKRPKQTTEQGACGDHWGQAYYEYKINKQQQRRLEQLERKIGNSGVVTYCCAAFLKKSDLWKNEEKAKIIENSNFIGASQLNGHTRYTYINAGHEGFANSEPKEIKDKPILQKIVNSYGRSEGGLIVQLKSAANIVEEIMNEEDPNGVSLYFRLVNRLLDGFESRRSATGIIESIVKVMAFNTVNSTSWTIIASPPEATFD